MRFESLIKEYEKIKFKIRRTEIKEQELRELLGFPMSAGAEGMPKSKTNSSSVENSVLKLTEILDERKRLEEDLAKSRTRILDVIDLCSNLDAREIIETKIFIQNCGWKFVSKKMYLSESYCRQLFRDGLLEINQKMEEMFDESQITL